MRGFLEPAVRTLPTESQRAFQTLSRNRRVKLAKAANTTLLKADQWARGGGVTSDVASALDQAFQALKSKKK